MNQNQNETQAFLTNLKGMDDEINHWIKNKPPMIAIMTFFQAFKADRLFDILNNLDSLFPGDNVERFHLANKWIKFYRTPSTVITGALEQVFNHFQKDKALGKLLVGLYRAFSSANKKLPESNIINGLTEFFSISEEKALKIIDFFRNLPIDEWEVHFNELPDIDYAKHRFRPNAEFYFFVRITLLCQFFFGENVEDLFQKAQSGDVDSICKLLKLDKGIIQDRKIARFITKHSQKKKGDEFNKISRAFADSIKISSLQKAKTNQAAMASAFAKSMSAKLSAPDIQYIYDLVNRAKTDGVAPDPHLPSPEAFAKTIQRKAPSYSKVFSPDKK